MTCNATPTPPSITAQPTELAPLAPPIGRTRLMVQPSDKQELTSNQETDARTALARGIKEYLEQLQWTAQGGRHIRFERVLDVWAEPEDGKAGYPCAVVQGTGPGTYDASKFSPSPSDKDRLPSGLFLVSPCELVQAFQVEVWAVDPEERLAIVAMLESALIAPTSWLYGIRLSLPHYFGLVAEYEFTGLNYIDSEQDAVRRYRKAMVTLTGRVPVARAVALPLAVVVPALGMLSAEQEAAMRNRTSEVILRLALDVT